jgi:hypothetical protein
MIFGLSRGEVWVIFAIIGASNGIKETSWLRNPPLTSFSSCDVAFSLIIEGKVASRIPVRLVQPKTKSNRVRFDLGKGWDN